MNWNMSIFIELLNPALFFDTQTDNIFTSILFSLEHSHREQLKLTPGALTAFFFCPDIR